MVETLRIEGMSCDGCVNSVRKALQSLPVQNVEVELGKARVTYEEKMVNNQQLVRAIEDAGFEVVQTWSSMDEASTDTSQRPDSQQGL